jgi:DNA-binding SARP family transcriptional activator
LNYRIRYRILGPLKVDPRIDHPVLQRRKPRALLALLLLRANEVVPESDIHFALGSVRGDVPRPRLRDFESPATYLSHLQEAFEEDVSQLREALGKDVLVREADRYMMLRVRPDELDRAVFERLVAKARGAFTATRAERLHSALALWRGPALAEFEFIGWPKQELTRLEWLRLDALDERITADLELDRHHELADELPALVAEHPINLRFLGHLMVALDRAGRAADALAAYQEGCRVLREESGWLGCEPDDELRELARRIREQDAT